MTLFDWLATPAGIELAHGVTILMLAVAGWLTYSTRRNTQVNSDKLDSHIEQHAIGTAHTTSSVVDSSEHDM